MDEIKIKFSKKKSFVGFLSGLALLSSGLWFLQSTIGEGLSLGVLFAVTFILLGVLILPLSVKQMFIGSVALIIDNSGIYDFCNYSKKYISWESVKEIKIVEYRITVPGRNRKGAPLRVVSIALDPNKVTRKNDTNIALEMATGLFSGDSHEIKTGLLAINQENLLSILQSRHNNFQARLRESSDTQAV